MLFACKFQQIDVSQPPLLSSSSLSHTLSLFLSLWYLPENLAAWPWRELASVATAGTSVDGCLPRRLPATERTNATLAETLTAHISLFHSHTCPVPAFHSAAAARHFSLPSLSFSHTLVVPLSVCLSRNPAVLPRMEPTSAVTAAIPAPIRDAGKVSKKI